MIDHVMKVHSVKTVNSNVIAETMVHVIRKRANACAVLVLPANFVKRNARPEHLDLIVHCRVTAIPTIRSHVIQLMDNAFVENLGQVNIQPNTDHN